MTSQVLMDAGLIAGGDMTPEAALSKLSYVLAKKDLDLEGKKKVGVLTQEGRHVSVEQETLFTEGEKWGKHVLVCVFPRV